MHGTPAPAYPPALATWLSAVRRYLLALGLLNLVWEYAQLPLYTLWREGTPWQLFYYPLHCTGGDIMIGALALLAALMLAGSARWPAERWRAVMLSAIGIGIAYTAYSEWFNVYVRKSWAYSPLMPLLPGTGIGSSPLLQWILVPVAAFRVAAGWPSRAKTRDADVRS